MRLDKMRLLKFSLFIAITVIAASCKVSSKTTEKVAVAPGIQFIEDDWNLALKKAQSQNKLVFVDIYATWCGPCKMLKQYTFTDSAVGEFFNKNFINVSIDAEKGVGLQLAQQFSVDAYPTLVVTDATGKPVLLTVGYLPVDYLLQFANEAVKRNLEQPKL
jgi:thioredoxin 1